jgi:proteasome accessory factor B
MKSSTPAVPVARLTRPPLERMMRIHQAVVAGGYPNATTLANEIEVTTKTIQRDIEFMRDRLQLPIEYDSRRYGYYYTQPVSSFPTLQITEGELFALLVAEKALQQYRGTNFEKPLLSAFKKMESSLPDTVSLNWSDWDQSISFRTSAEPILDLEIFDTLAQATARHQQLDLQYAPGSKQTELRTIDPPIWRTSMGNGSSLLTITCGKAFGRSFPRAFTGPTDRQELYPSTRVLHRKILRDSFGVHSARRLSRRDPLRSLRCGLHPRKTLASFPAAARSTERRRGTAVKIVQPRRSPALGVGLGRQRAGHQTPGTGPFRSRSRQTHPPGKVGRAARPPERQSWGAHPPRVQRLRTGYGSFVRLLFFRQGAENSTRGACAPLNGVWISQRDVPTSPLASGLE